MVGTGEKPFPTTEREGASSLSLRHCGSPIASRKQTIKQPTRARLIPQLNHVTNLRPVPLITKLNCDASLPHAFHTIQEQSLK